MALVRLSRQGAGLGVTQSKPLQSIVVCGLAEILGWCQLAVMATLVCSTISYRIMLGRVRGGGALTHQAGGDLDTLFSKVYGIRAYIVGYMIHGDNHQN